MTERATLDFVKAWGRRGWEVRQAPERSRKKHIDLKNIPMMMMMPGWQRLAGFRGPQQNPSELSESAYLQIFATKRSFFINAGKQAICGWQKDLHTHRHVPSNTLFDVKIYMYFGYVLVVRKLSKSGLSNSSTKAGSLKAL